MRSLYLLYMLIHASSNVGGCLKQLTLSSAFKNQDDTGLQQEVDPSRGVNKVQTESVADENIHDAEDMYLYTSASLPENPQYRPTIANGHIGTVVHTDTVHMNGVYNGHLTHSHRAVIPSTVNVNITDIAPRNGHVKRWFSLNAKTGIFQETLFSDGVAIYFRVYAHRSVSALVVLEIEALRTSSSQSDITISLDNPGWTSSPDMDFHGHQRGDGTIYKVGAIKDPETNDSGHTQVHVIYDAVPDLLVLKSNTDRVTWTFLTAMHVTKAATQEGYQIGRAKLRNGTLYNDHVSSWKSIWSRGTIELKGDTRLAKMTTGSLYYIMSSIPTQEETDWPFIGLSPNGLPWGKKGIPYSGAVFWDQDTFMYPSILALHSDFGKCLLDARKRTMGTAKMNAKKYGLKGLKYAWESRFTGLETTPWAAAAKNELHVNGDIVFAIMQYFWSTGDVSIFDDDVYDDIIIGIADMWISKLKFNKTKGKYITLDVCGPDEYHPQVNNSVYINVVAKLTLEAAAKLTRNRVIDNTSRLPHNKYQYHADRIFVNVDDKIGFHPEYNGYAIGTKIKQADVILLAYPLMYNMSMKQRHNDMNIYEKVTDVNGPAMTWSMSTVNWLELGQHQKAYDNLKKMYDNVASVFQVWSEVIHGRGAPHFITGQGGFLQAILFGYGGFRIRENRLNFDFNLPPNITEISIKGFDYMGSSVDFLATADHVNITLTGSDPGARPLYVHQSGTSSRLHTKKALQIPRTKAYVAKYM